MSIKISPRKFSATEIARFLKTQQAQNLSYEPLSGTRTGQQILAYSNDYQRVMIGKGEAVFQLAKQALQRWVHFPAHWTEIVSNGSPPEVGVAVALFFKLFGFFWLNACRVIYVKDEPRRYGFAYGTLPGHIERGEELFQVEMDENGAVWYEIRAFSRPKLWLVWLAFPLARLLQAKFRHDSADAVRRFVASGGAVVSKPVWRPDFWLLAGLLFVGLSIFTFPGTALHHDFGKPVLVFASLLVAPVALHLLREAGLLPGFPKNGLTRWLFPAAVFFAFGQISPPGIFFETVRPVLLLPWLVLSICFAGGAIADFLKNGKGNFTQKMGATAGLAFWAIGAFWAFVDAAGLRILNFDATIGRLTALHFHFAGLALPVLAVLAWRKMPSFFGKTTIWAVVLGVPLTAVGITATYFQLGALTEAFAGTFMSFSGMLVAAQLLRLNFRGGNFWFFVSGATLFFTMTLSAAYALRVFLPFSVLSIDWMRAVHGALNAFLAVGFGLIGFAKN